MSQVGARRQYERPFYKMSGVLNPFNLGNRPKLPPTKWAATVHGFRKQSIYLSIHQSVHAFIHPSIRPSMHPSLSLSLSLYVCLYLSIYISMEVGW